MNSSATAVTSKRIAYFDYFKAICIIMVIINHYVQSCYPSFKDTFIFSGIIRMAVPVFMIISGFTMASSFDKKNLSLCQTYAPKQLASRFLRFLIPFSFEFVIEAILSVYILSKTYTASELFYCFWTGGVGKNGSYYIPVMLQFIVIFPVIYYLIKRFKSKGLILCIAANLIYEILCAHFKIAYEPYRLLMPRYITYVAFGCFYYFDKQKARLHYITLFIAGVIANLIHATWFSTLIFRRWRATSMLVAFMVFPVFVFLSNLTSKYSQKFSDTKSAKLLSLIGNASYHIFLFQMLFYNLFDNYITEFVKTPFINLPLNIIICVIFGIIFYKLESRVSKKALLLLK